MNGNPQKNQGTRNIPEESNVEEECLRINPDIPEAAILTRRSSPYAFFNLIFTDALMEEIRQQTSIYNNWRYQTHGNKCVAEITLEEINQFIGIIIYIGVVKLPARRMYWATKTRVDKIANVMTRNRFEEILTTIHFNDNGLIPDAESPNYNKTYKMQPLVDYLCKCFKDVTLPETYQSINEQVIPFKGKSGLKRYLPKKTHKWGYKLGHVLESQDTYINLKLMVLRR